jgi:hypothetical protein
MEEQTPASNAMHKEFYTCIARVKNDLPTHTGSQPYRALGITEAQIQAYYAQFPLGRTESGDAPCYAQYWRIPKSVMVLTTNGSEDILRLTVPVRSNDGILPEGGIDGLGTRDVNVRARPGGIPGRYLAYSSELKENGSINYDPAYDVLRRDEDAGFDLRIQRMKTDVGGRLVDAYPVDRSKGFRFYGSIPSDAPEAFKSLSGASVTTNLDERFIISYYVGREDLHRIESINESVKNRIRSFLVEKNEIKPITTFSEAR